ncbi:MAG: ribosome maturation factor RimP [Lyngbya sp. HA4199-MV5]|jgi:ribosome maturation factor RimP|nr:ribosome maturation factor RimP [Lyngbya sp. HA4199-MV5]
MVHPLIPHVIDLAQPLTETLGLQLVGAVFYTHQQPPVLRVDICHPDRDISLEDCEQMSRALESALDAIDIFPDAYVLEVSSPGISRSLTTDREFISFKGFPVIVSAAEPYGGKQEWTGKLIRRDDSSIQINQKGRTISIPRALVTKVQLEDQQ